MDPSQMSLVPQRKTCLVKLDKGMIPLRHSEPNLITHLPSTNPFQHRASYRDDFFEDILEDGNSSQSRINFTNGSQIDSLSVVLSALYCKLTVVLGLALPVTQIISQAVPSSFYHGFYIYLYGGSLAFIISLYLINLRNTAISRITSKRFRNPKSLSNTSKNEKKQRINNYGSFYLRLGATAFGIGSMVYSGLEFGEFFADKENADCNKYLIAVKPFLRMCFTILQLHFIFLSDNSMDILKNQVILRFSLAHMLSTNLCEWLSVIVEEAKHEIDHLRSEEFNIRNDNVSSYTVDTNCLHLSGIFIRDASSYLFPCTIEYSLICAVTLIEMWKDVHIEVKNKKSNTYGQTTKKVTTRHYYTVDCTHSQKGLICGLIFNVYTIITLIIFFSLRVDPGRENIAATLLTVCETVAYSTSIVAMVMAATNMRHLPYSIHRLDSKGSLRLGLDLTLLLKAQIGMYVYHMFSAFACYFIEEGRIWPDIFSLVQTTVQTVFILDIWWKRCGTSKDQTSKPGREVITYLRVVNMGLWAISIMEKNRAQLRPIQLEFFGPWTWVIITHVSMPLAIFYRFHSTICLFEIWRNAYKDVSAEIDHDIVFN